MQTINTETYTLVYPNRVVYAFTPALFTITSLVGHLKARISVAGKDSGSFTEERDLRNGSVTFDISRYLQLLYRDVDFRNISYVGFRASTTSPFVIEASVNITLLGVGNSPAQVMTGDLYFDVIWGVMTSSSNSLGIKQLRWFVNYPMTCCIPARDNTEFSWGGVVDEPLGDPKESGGSQYFRKEWVLPMVNDWEGYVPSRNPIKLTVNDTERVAGDNITIGSYECLIIPDFSTCGVYLRWVDELGCYRYYLLRETGYSTTAKESETWESGAVVNPLTFDNTVNVPSTSRQLLTRQHSRTLTAQSATEDDVKLLRTLIASPIIEEYAGVNESGIPLWRRVAVKAGSISDNFEHLQNVSVTIEEAVVETQTL